MPTDYRDCVVLAAKVAEGMLRSGGEAYRSQECCESILVACGAENISVVAIATALFVSADVDGEHRTEVVSVKSRTIDLEGIERYNSISRCISAGTMDIEQAFKEVEKNKTLPLWKMLVFGAFSAACFSYVFGGDFNDFLPALLTAGVALIFKFFADKLCSNSFISTMGACMITAALARLSVFAFPSLSQEAIIVAGIVSMLPGLAITNALRDTIHGDLISGLARGAEALLTAVIIATGVIIVLAI